jgi:hypothetical protein
MWKSIEVHSMMRLGAIPVAVPFVFCLFIVAAGTATHALAASDPPCLPATEAEQSFRRWILRIVTGATADPASDRALHQLPLISDTADVYYVQDSALCTQAGRRLALLVGADTVRARPVHLLRFGSSHFFVFNYERHGESFLYSLFDSQFEHVKSFR